ncbi:hypothetical protein AZKH_3065 [Azoarcus sp. KH32C]|nr:hypothetical protein AZKH_3065 [Azoarcus sp. KH32C]
MRSRGKTPTFPRRISVSGIIQTREIDQLLEGELRMILQLLRNGKIITGRHLDRDFTAIENKGAQPVTKDFLKDLTETF